jgi:hypothetical protein
MHPEIVSDTPGNCPKCGMALVPKSEAKQTAHHEDKGLGVLTWKSYMPLIVIIGVILLATIALSVRDAGLGVLSVEGTISYFMIGFFLTFSAFKLMDLKGFAHGYQTYDLLAKRVPVYGYVYPFIELCFGLAMILMPFSVGLLVAEFVVMAFSGLGVAIKLARREEFMCACLGTFLKIPLTKVTLVEDFGMAALALVMLVLAIN